jgi:cell division control protein 45
MVHSNYIFSKMALWIERGHKKLHEFIHTLGISLQDAKQLYKYMPAEGQRKLDGSVFAAAEKHGLLDITYHSFARNVDHSAPFMASDFVHILTATL